MLDDASADNLVNKSVNEGAFYKFISVIYCLCVLHVVWGETCLETALVMHCISKINMLCIGPLPSLPRLQVAICRHKY